MYIEIRRESESCSELRDGGRNDQHPSVVAGLHRQERIAGLRLRDYGSQVHFRERVVLALALVRNRGDLAVAASIRVRVGPEKVVCFFVNNLQVHLDFLVFELPHQRLGSRVLNLQFFRNLSKKWSTRLMGNPSSKTLLNSLILMARGILAYLQPLRDGPRLRREDC